MLVGVSQEANSKVGLDVERTELQEKWQWEEKGRDPEEVGRAYTLMLLWQLYEGREDSGAW